MHTVDLLDQAIAVAERLGYRVRMEYLGETGSGVCEIGGQKWLFLDLALNATEQLGQVMDVLRLDPGFYNLKFAGPLADGVLARKSA